MPDEVRIGPFAFTFEPDGDDPGTGWLRVETRDGTYALMQCSRVEWGWFVEDAT